MSFHCTAGSQTIIAKHISVVCVRKQSPTFERPHFNFVLRPILTSALVKRGNPKHRKKKGREPLRTTAHQLRRHKRKAKNKAPQSTQSTLVSTKKKGAIAKAGGKATTATQRHRGDNHHNNIDSSIQQREQTHRTTTTVSTTTNHCTRPHHTVQGRNERPSLPLQTVPVIIELLCGLREARDTIAGWCLYRQRRLPIFFRSLSEKVRYLQRQNRIESNRIGRKSNG